MDKKLFKQMFSEYCQSEINKGRCGEYDCQQCPVNMAWNHIFYGNFELEYAIEKVLEQYDSDNIDIVVNEESNGIDIMYHSDDNSFCVVENVCSIDDYSDDDVESVANLYNIGYVL